MYNVLEIDDVSTGFALEPARQSLGRPLMRLEAELAQALEEIFTTGQHDLQEVSRQLQGRAVARPSGATGAWSVAVLEEELRLINHSLDTAYGSAAASDTVRLAGADAP